MKGVSPGLRTLTCYAERSEPQFGLEPRFEALPQFGKSPNTSGGVMAKAITPLPQLVNILSPSELFITNNQTIILINHNILDTRNYISYFISNIEYNLINN